MSETWTDEAFLGYCVLHCQTPRALFSRVQVDRLQALAGNDPIPWDGTYPTWCGLHAETILPVVARARERLAGHTRTLPGYTETIVLIVSSKTPEAATARAARIRGKAESIASSDPDEP